ncbi:hypothetical protein [Pseudobdellovibrio sp. HCB154]|uniref:hypothetical protein n=1 Tax=Pseudobdellovibrio sp. HCB154 TaxID=3386277 RepID=UPI003916F096
MKNLILATTLFLAAQTSMAKTSLICYEKIANTVERVQTVNVEVGERVKLFEDGINSSYITEKKPGFFSMELFMGNREQRLYSEGNMAEKGSIIVAIWTRDELIEIECTK